MTNTDLCNLVFQFLEKINVEDIVVCAGARNAPLIAQLEAKNFKVHTYFEERSAGFYSLGLAKSKNKPVAIFTTSGTAVAELLPAVIEAFYQGRPLIIVSADRPKTYRNSGAPQTINQVGLFSHYVEQTLDLDFASPEVIISTRLDKPLHLNVCFDEPLFDKSSGHHDVGLQLLPKLKKNLLNDRKIILNPAIIVGSLEPSEMEETINFLKDWNGPIYLESLSQIKPLLKTKYILESTDTLLQYLFRKGHCESIIRLGGVPTLRFWRDLEFEFKAVPVFNFTHLELSGLSRPTKTYDFDLSQIRVQITKDFTGIKEIDIRLQNFKQELFNKFSLKRTCVHQSPIKSY